MKRKEFLRNSGIFIGASGFANSFGNSIEQILQKEKQKKTPNLIIINLSGGIRNEDIYQDQKAMPKLFMNSKPFPIQCPSTDHKINFQHLMFGGKAKNGEFNPSLFEHLNQIKQYSQKDCFSIYEGLGNLYTSALHKSELSDNDSKFANEINSNMKVDYKLPYYLEISDRASIVSKFEHLDHILTHNAPKIINVNFSEMDICHSNYSDYLKILNSIDLGIDVLAERVKSLPNYKENTVILVISSLGRNSKSNSIKDNNGKFGYDHNHESALNTFASIINLSKLNISLSPIGNVQKTYTFLDIHFMICEILNIEKEVMKITATEQKYKSPVIIY